MKENILSVSVDENEIFASRLITDNYVHLLRFANYYLGNCNYALDLVHDTFLAALQQSGKFGNKSSERTWLTSILKNKLLRHLRRNKKITFQDSNALAALWQKKLSEKTNALFDQPFSKKEFMRILCDGIYKLSEPARTVFILKYVHNENSANICIKLSLSNANFWVICHRSRRFIKNHLKSSGYSFE
jgi:RNA polymerase sigma factor (sigma-70 family)